MTHIQATSMDGLMGTPMQQVWTPTINRDFGSIQQPSKNNNYHYPPHQLPPIQKKIEYFITPPIESGPLPTTESQKLLDKCKKIQSKSLVSLAIIFLIFTCIGLSIVLTKVYGGNSCSTVGIIIYFLVSIFLFLNLLAIVV